MRKRYLGIICGLIILIAIFLIFFRNNEEKEQDILSLNLKEHKNLNMHIHPIVNIDILGEKIPIPSDVGISQGQMKVIHTHDENGKLHIESPIARQFYLKDFFTIWGKTFNSTCILDNCIDDKHKITVLVNGIENGQYEDIPLNDHDRIMIFYEQK